MRHLTKQTISWRFLAGIRANEDPRMVWALRSIAVPETQRFVGVVLCAIS